jgi:hypothetical protein
MLGVFDVPAHILALLALATISVMVRVSAGLQWQQRPFNDTSRPVL